MAFAHTLATESRFRAKRQSRPLPRLRRPDVLVLPAVHEKEDPGALRRGIRRNGRGARVHPGLARLSQLRGLRHARERYRRRPRLGGGIHPPQSLTRSGNRNAVRRPFRPIASPANAPMVSDTWKARAVPIPWAATPTAKPRTA